MKITFVNPALENQSIEILSAVLKSHGHKTALVVDPRLFDTEAIQNRRLKYMFDNTERVVEEVLDSDPDLVGFSIFTIHFQWALRLSRLIKNRRDVPIIMGGIHPSTLPDLVIAQDCVDIVCVGEGEDAITELAESRDKGQYRTDIQNLWFKEGNKIIRNPIRDLLQDLDSLPLPDKHLFKEKGALDTYEYCLMAARGCPFRCTYCGNDVWRKLYRGKGRYLRRRSVESVINESLWAKKNFSPSVFSFYADVFTSDELWLEEFSKQYRKDVNVPFFALAHPRFMNQNIARMLKDAGCLEVTMGVESAINETRKKLLNRPESNEEIISAVRACQQVRLPISLDQLVNLPFETEDHMIETLDFYNHLRPDSMNVYPLQYLPGTEITEIAREAKILDQKQINKINQGKSSSSIVVGVGGQDSFDPTGRLSFLRSLLTILPILPTSFVTLIIRKGWFRSPFKIPMLIFALLKILTKLRVHRGYVYRGIIRDTFKNIHRTLLWKSKNNSRRKEDLSSLKNLLIITPFFSPNVGGVETRFDDICNSLSGRAIRVAVLTYKPLTTPGISAPFHEKKKNLEIFRLWWPGFNLFHKLEKHTVLLTLYLTPGLLLMGMCFLLFSNKKLDVVHAAGLNSALAARILYLFWNIKWVMSTHALYGFEKNSITSRLVRWILKSSHNIICVCKSSRDELLEIGVPDNKLISHTTWVNQKVFRPLNSIECKEELNINGKPNILFVGRLLEKKGIKVFLDIADRMPDYRFHIIGEGPLNKYVKERSDKLGNVIFIGSVPNRILPKYYNASELTVMPSLYREPFGRVAAESLSCGVPVVLTELAEIANFLYSPIAEKATTEPVSIMDAIKRTMDRIRNRDDVSTICREFAIQNFGEKNISTLLKGYGFSAD